MWSRYLQCGLMAGLIEPGPALMGLAWSSRAALAIAPLQDLLNLGREARMNVPGRAGGNWRWRCTDEMLMDKPFAWLRELTAQTAGGYGIVGTGEGAE